MPVYQVDHQVNGEIVQINIEMDEVNAVPKSVYPAERGIAEAAKKVTKATRDVLADGIQLAQDCAMSVAHGIQAMDQKIGPTAFEVQFSIKLDADAGAVLVKMGAEAQLQVTMKWTREDRKWKSEEPK